MLACALCIANPQACPNPEWYTKFCLLLNEMYPVTPDENSSPKMNGLRSRMQQHAQNLAAQSDDGGQKLPVRQESRATVAMLAPAVHIMHQHPAGTTSLLIEDQKSLMIKESCHLKKASTVWKGMAWVTDGIDDDEEDSRLYQKMEQGITNESTGSVIVKRLSTIVETSSVVREQVGEMIHYNDLHRILQHLGRNHQREQRRVQLEE
ncbi:hypothetical protein KIN20_002476 [Parelaphostrongylus tenuis]|uniref:Uncharacterized protein n=1 Tax=Parelaphostrongylus tenuis TaxID=148309 RepID=A0AAD5QHT4_PARTN|nr:hypothetical protein KIN20_002476 [Parelaphostrongylus tenuis]